MGKLFFSIICLGVHLLCVYTMYKQSFDWVHVILMVAAAISFLYVNDFFSVISGRKALDYDDDDDLDFLPKKSTTTNAVKPSVQAAPEKRLFSQDIYQAIEEFARLCYQCKQKTGLPYEIDYVSLCVYHESKYTNISITCHGKNIACYLPDEYKSLRVNNDEIHYFDENITGYVVQQYRAKVPSGDHALFAAYQRGDPNILGDYVGNEGNSPCIATYIGFKYQ